MAVPAVSVCIPTYNSAAYLPDAIDSVLAQDRADYELVVCDNASTDDTQRVCGEYRDPRLRYVRFNELVGQAANWNRCLELAAGPYIVLLHADDTLAPAFLHRAADVLDVHADVDLVHCSVEHVDAKGTVIHFQRLYGEDRIDRGEVLARRLLLEGCVVNPAGVMVRRSAYEAVGRFAEEIVWGVDWHMWLRIALRGGVAYLAEPLARYRQHADNGTSTVMATARNGLDETWMLNDIWRRLPAGRTDLLALRRKAMRQVAHRTWCFAEEMCRQGAMRAARAGVRRAVQVRPALCLHGRVWALWAATYLGYRWFERMHGWKQLFTGTFRRASAGTTRSSGMR